MAEKRNLNITPHIQWHEGMMLSPQHFQQYDLRQYQILSHHLHLLSPYHWGVYTLKIDPITLPEGVIRILEVEVVMPDGLIINYSATMTHLPPLELDIREFKPQTSKDELTIYLSIPERIKERSPVVGEFPRFYSIEGEDVPDENVPEHLIKIPRLFPKLTLTVGENVPARCIGFPLMKISFKDESFVKTTYMPPCFYVTQDMVLWQICAELTQKIREKALYLSEKWQNQLGTPLALETESTLKILLTCLPSLETLIHGVPVHPQVLFQKFTEVVGILSCLRLSQLPPLLPGYFHNDINACFMPLLELIRQCLNSIEQNYSMFIFKQKERLFYLRLHKTYVDEKLLIGVRAPKGMTENQLKEWVEDCIICSDFAIDHARNRRITGAVRKELQGEELYELMPSRDMLIYEVSVDPEFIKEEQNLNIFNLADTPEKRPIEVLLYVQNKKRG